MPVIVCNTLRLPAIVSGLLIVCGAQSAFAISAGCAAFTGTQTSPITPNFWQTGGFGGPSQIEFEAGDILTVTSTGNTDPIDFFADLPSSVSFGTIPTGGGSVTGMITETGAYRLQFNTASMIAITVSFSCTAGGSGAEAAATSAALATVTATATATAGLIAGRVGSVFSPSNTGGGMSSPQGSPAPEAGGGAGSDGSDAPALTTGGAGQGADAPISIWTNFSWTGVNNSNAVARSGTDVLTAVAGVDTMVSPYTLAGAAVALSWADTDTPDGAFTQHEFSFIVAPYVAYAVTDVVSIDGSVGYGVGFSNSKRTGGITGDATNHRYFVSLNGSARHYWGNFGLFGTAGLLWTQSFQGEIQESDGNLIDSSDVQIGTLKLKVQPSYLIPFDLVTVEPYAGLGYSYDYRLTEIAGSANDRGQIDLTAGINVFGDGVSGSLEFQHGFFRENERRSSASATLRIQF